MIVIEPSSLTTTVTSVGDPRQVDDVSRGLWIQVVHRQDVVLEAEEVTDRRPVTVNEIVAGTRIDDVAPQTTDDVVIARACRDRQTKRALDQRRREQRVPAQGSERAELTTGGPASTAGSVTVSYMQYDPTGVSPVPSPPLAEKTLSPSPRLKVAVASEAKARPHNGVSVVGFRLTRTSASESVSRPAFRLISRSPGAGTEDHPGEAGDLGWGPRPRTCWRRLRRP